MVWLRAGTLLIVCARKRKTVRCYCSAFCPNQVWDEVKKEWIEEK